MGRRANYGFEKRQRELKKQKKKEAKAEKKRLAREAAAAEAEGLEPGEHADGEAAEAQDGDGAISPEAGLDAPADPEPAHESPSVEVEAGTDRA